MELISFSEMDAEIKRLRTALREALELAEFLTEQGWGRKLEPGDNEDFDRLKAIVNE